MSVTNRDVERESYRNIQKLDAVHQVQNIIANSTFANNEYFEMRKRVLADCQREINDEFNNLPGDCEEVRFF